MTTNSSINNPIDRRQWLSKCRGVLIEMETKNIRQRALSWSQIVNSETERINAMLNIDGSSIASLHHTSPPSTAHSLSTSLPSIYPYSYTVPEPTKYLSFLTEWSGIKSRSASSSPSSYEEFESKAKNWLNGRRAPNYGNTLFPDMLTSAEAYSTKVAQSVFGSVPIDKWSAAPISSSLCTLYQKALLFAFIEKLCSSRIAVHQNWKKTNLLCENSVKNQHSKTAKLLQQYAVHDHHGGPDLHSFPGNLQRAAGFFQQQHSKYLQRLIAALNDYRGGHGLPPKTETNPFSSNHSNKRGPSESGGWNEHHQRVRGGDGSSPLVAIKERDYNAILLRLGALEQRHNDQAKEISDLTAKCTALQSRLEGNSCCPQTMRGDDASNSKTLTNSPSISHHSVHSAHSMHSAPSNSSNHLKLPPSAPRIDYRLTPQQLPVIPPQANTQIPVGLHLSTTNVIHRIPPPIHSAPRSAPTASSSSSSSFDGVSMMHSDSGYGGQKPLELSYDWPPGPGAAPIGSSTHSDSMRIWTPSDRRPMTSSSPWSLALTKNDDDDMQCHPSSPSMIQSGDCNMTLMTSSTPNSARMNLSDHGDLNMNMNAIPNCIVYGNGNGNGNGNGSGGVNGNVNGNGNGNGNVSGHGPANMFAFSPMNYP